MPGGFLCGWPVAGSFLAIEKGAMSYWRS